MKRALLAAALAVACRGGQTERPGKDAAGPTRADSGAAPPAALVTADTATVDAPLSLPAQLYVEHDAAVFARSAGVVESLLADLGGRVQGGQLLATLENTDQEIALAQARHGYENAKSRVERQRALKTAGVVTEADSEQVEFEYREAELALRKAQRDHDLTRITAPFAGVVTSRTARIGRLVHPGDSLFRVTALAPDAGARCGCPRPPRSAPAQGTSAQVTGARGEHGSARVVRASPVIDAASGTREVVLQLAPGSSSPPAAASRCGWEPSGARS